MKMREFEAVLSELRREFYTMDDVWNSPATRTNAALRKSVEYKRKEIMDRLADVEYKYRVQCKKNSDTYLRRQSKRAVQELATQPKRKP